MRNKTYEENVEHKEHKENEQINDNYAEYSAYYYAYACAYDSICLVTCSYAD